jgi:hypothetical protein
MYVCFGNFTLGQKRDLEKHYSLLLGVRNFGVKQNHNTMWGGFETTRFATTHNKIWGLFK